MKFYLITGFLLIFLTSLAQDTANIEKAIFLYKATDFSLDTINDTSFFHFHQYEIHFQNFGINTGNGVCAFYSFRSNFLSNIPFWLRPLEMYYSDIENFYMHTRYPFTKLKFIANTNRTYNEEIVKVLHSQNINRKWNILFSGISNKRTSKIPHQENRFHYLHGSTNYQGNHYQLWANYYFSRLKTKENGGVQNPSFLTDSLFPYENAKVYLLNAANRYGIKKFDVTQLFTFSAYDSLNKSNRLWFTQKFNSIRAKKIFTDSSPDTSYYPNIFIDSLKTYDSLFYQQIKLSSGIIYANKPMQGNGFQILCNYHHRTNYSIQNPITQDGLSVDVNFWKKWNKQYFSLRSNYGFYGYLSNTYSIELISSRKINCLNKSYQWISLVHFNKKEPDVFEKSFYSNHFQWNRIATYAQQYLAETSLRRDYNLIKFFFVHAKNITQFNDNLIPYNLPSVNIMGSEIAKLLRLINLYSYHKLLGQWISDKTIRLPALSAYHSLYIQQKLFKKVLTIQAGADVWYHSYYQNVSYSPVLNTFYNQTDNTEVGFYPFVGVFINAHLKRARFFVKMDHLNHQWTKSNFFLINGYALPPRMLKFGICWNFYD